MPRRLPVALFAFCAGIAAPMPAAADVHEVRGDGFIIRHSLTVAQSPKAVWLALVKPADWWSSEHTWSGDAKNMTLTPQGGGCWCERLPADPSGDFAGSVSHGTVIQANPAKILRLDAALGPMQSEPARGILTFALKPVAGGTEVQLEYNVGGSMRFKPSEMAPAVDKVLGLQLARLAKALGGTAEAGSSSGQAGSDVGAQIDQLKAD